MDKYTKLEWESMHMELRRRRREGESWLTRNEMIRALVSLRPPDDALPALLREMELVLAVQAEVRREELAGIHTRDLTGAQVEALRESVKERARQKCVGNAGAKTSKGLDSLQFMASPPGYRMAMAEGLRQEGEKWRDG